MKGAMLTNTQQVRKIPPITFLEPPNATLFGIFKLAGHFQQCQKVPESDFIINSPRAFQMWALHALKTSAIGNNKGCCIEMAIFLHWHCDHKQQSNTFPLGFEGKTGVV
jgi:hypothetical protein